MHRLSIPLQRLETLGPSIRNRGFYCNREALGSFRHVRKCRVTHTYVPIAWWYTARSITVTLALLSKPTDAARKAHSPHSLVEMTLQSPARTGDTVAVDVRPVITLIARRHTSPLRISTIRSNKRDMQLNTYLPHRPQPGDEKPLPFRSLLGRIPLLSLYYRVRLSNLALCRSCSIPQRRHAVLFMAAIWSSSRRFVDPMVFRLWLHRFVSTRPFVTSSSSLTRRVRDEMSV